MNSPLLRTRRIEIDVLDYLSFEDVGSERARGFVSKIDFNNPSALRLICGRQLGHCRSYPSRRVSTKIEIAIGSVDRPCRAKSSQAVVESDAHRAEICIRPIAQREDPVCQTRQPWRGIRHD